MSLNWAKKDLTKKRFGRLLVVSESKKRYSNGLVLWDCVCDCGKKKTVNGASLRSGKSKSCGCLMLDTVRLPKGEAAFNKLFSAYNLGAKNRGHNFELKKEDFKKIVESDCFYCGDKPSQMMFCSWLWRPYTKTIPAKPCNLTVRKSLTGVIRDCDFMTSSLSGKAQFLENR